MREFALWHEAIVAKTLSYVEPDMGSELKPEIWGQLPSEVKALIMMALAKAVIIWMRPLITLKKLVCLIKHLIR